MGESDVEPLDRRRRLTTMIALTLGGAAFAAFWSWALFFASKEPVNRIGDTAWAERAQSICAAADDRRTALADFREMRDATTALVLERADIVDDATDIIETMLNDVVAVAATDPKGREVVPLWASEYRTYIADRRRFTERLRATGVNEAFYETESGGIPISERLETFAGDNRMPACAPPRDLSR